MIIRSAASPFPKTRLVRVFPRLQFFSALAQFGVRLKVAPSAARHGDHGRLPVRAPQAERRWLHRTLDQPTGARPALRGAGDFSSAPQQVKKLVAHEALARRSRRSSRREESLIRFGCWRLAVRNLRLSLLTSAATPGM